MSTNLPLSVRLVTVRADRHIERDLRDLTFREVAIGGWASASMSLDRPLSLQPDEIAYYGRCYIYDTRTGQTVWEGRLEDPGRGNGGDGEIWTLTAMGPAAHARDSTVPLIYVDRDMRTWVDAETTYAAGGRVTNNTAAANSTPVTPNFHYQWPANSILVSGSRVALAYPLLRASGQRLARYDYSWDAGRINSDMRVQSVTRDVSAGANGRDDGFHTTGGGTSARAIATDFANTRDWLELRVFYGGAPATIGDEVTWAEIYAPYVMATRYTRAGVEQLTAASYTAGTVLGSDVVADLLGRLLPQYDGAGASIATTSYAIEQLAYPDGIDPAGVLDDLMALEPGYRWGAYESNSAGKHRFEWIAWPSSIRYEADAVDGFDSPGSADGLYNAVRVRWVDATGQPQLTRRTAAVAELTAAGITREGLIDLGREVGTSANAIQAGDQWLAQHAAPPNRGELTVARPVVDLVTGRMVQPWEIKAGELIRVQGVLPRVDALNATARDGATIFRIASRTYSVRAASARLELDSYMRSTPRALAGVQVSRPRRQ